MRFDPVLPMGIAAHAVQHRAGAGTSVVYPPEDLSELTSRVERMIDPTTDAVHLLSICAACESRLVVRGQADATPAKPYWADL
ncbi:MAG: hypothetical protein ACRDTF_19300 [Pseudonocardiaceae bacterium]